MTITEALSKFPSVERAPRWVLYGLKDPRTGVLRYIGQTKLPRKRFRTHRLNSNRSADYNIRLYGWLKKLNGLGVEPHIELLGVFNTQETVNVQEQDWIADLRQANPGELLNICEGGKGVPKKGRIFSESHKRKLSEAAKRRAPMPKEEMRRRALKGWTNISAEGLKRQRESHRVSGALRSKESETKRVETRRLNGWNKRNT